MHVFLASVFTSTPVINVTIKWHRRSSLNYNLAIQKTALFCKLILQIILAYFGLYLVQKLLRSKFLRGWETCNVLYIMTTFECSLEQDKSNIVRLMVMKMNRLWVRIIVFNFYAMSLNSTNNRYLVQQYNNRYLVQQYTNRYLV